MVRLKYADIRPKKKTLELIEKINNICQRYHALSVPLSFRQLFYLLLAAGHVKNNKSAYGELVRLITTARTGGLIDWDFVSEGTRRTRPATVWRDIPHALDTLRDYFHLDHWQGQEYYLELWISKDGLYSLVAPFCREYGLTCVGYQHYLSATEAHEAAQNRFLPAVQSGRRPVILCLSDHDPAHLHMRKHAGARISEFIGQEVTVEHIGLHYDQVRLYQLPPRPDRITRIPEWYLDRYGRDCWEIEALEPTILQTLLKSVVEESYIDRDAWDRADRLEKQQTSCLASFIQAWNDRGGFHSSVEEVT